MAGESEFPVPIVGGAGRNWFWPVVALALVALAIAGYRLWFSDGSSQQLAETVAVTRTTIRSTIEASGSVESQESASLSFAIPGRVRHVAVALGDTVDAGQTLASVESDELDSAVLAAAANLELARLKLQQLLNGASPAEIAVAQQLVSSAQAARDKAADDVRKIDEGASTADLDAARSAVTKSEAALAESDDRLARLRAGASDADLAAADAGVAAASAALAAAEGRAGGCAGAHRRRAGWAAQRARRLLSRALGEVRGVCVLDGAPGSVDARSAAQRCIFDIRRGARA